MAVNQRNITIASFNYLIEVSVIPQKIRNNYLEHLLKRKNSNTQKNIKLLKCIYSYVNENRISEWDPAEVLEQTGMTMNALYIQKSRLLRSLREYYFCWKEKEEEVEQTARKNYTGGAYNNEDKREITVELEKARKMAEIGMTREAKCAYIKLEKKIRNSHFQQAEIYLIISEIYEYLAYYYLNKRQKRKLLDLINKLNKIIELMSMFKTKASHKQTALINIRLNFIKFYSYCIEWFTNPNAPFPEDHLAKAYALAVEINDYPYILKALHGRAVIDVSKGNFDNAKQLCKEGFNAAQEQRNKTAKYTFASMLHFMKVKEEPDNSRLNNNSIVDHYRKTKAASPFNLWTIFLENSIVMTFYPAKEKKVLDIFREQIDSNIMLGDFGFSVYWKFILDSEMFNDRLLHFFNVYNIHFKGYLEINKVDEKLLDEALKLCFNTECYHTKINDYGLTWLLHKLKLMTYYFREDGFEYDEVTPLLKTMEHLKKENKNLQGLRTYELLKLTLKMFEDQGNTKHMLNRYELNFKKLVDEFKNEPEELTIIDYAILSSFARRLRCREITDIVKALYRWIDTTHRGIFAPVFKDTRNKIHTIVGSGAAA